MPYAQRQDHQLFYEDHGRGEPIFFLPSFCTSTQLWRAQIVRFSTSYRVIAMDPRGHGQSSPSQPHDLYDLVDDALAVLDHAKIHQAIWVGLSIGGMISIRATLTHPKRVRALALFNTDGGAETFITKTEHRLLAILVDKIGIAAMTTPMQRKFFGQTSLRHCPQLIAEWTEQLHGVHVPSMLKTLDALCNRNNILQELGKITVPTLIVHGQEDRALPLDRALKLKKAIPHAIFRVLKQAGHLSCVEVPEEVNKTLIDFLTNMACAPIN
ncbi:MAG: alpha/beta fold hydrolase [Myxococcota bacterium]|nr:alpha/beta fold hydrolase [Myxococcota bacterium]